MDALAFPLRPGHYLGMSVSSFYNMLAQPSTLASVVGLVIAVSIIGAIKDQSPHEAGWDEKSSWLGERSLGRLWLGAQIFGVVLGIGLGILQLSIYFGYAPERLEPREGAFQLDTAGIGEWVASFGWHYVATLGLIFDIIGVILLFRYGLPPSVDRLGGATVMVGGGSNRARKKAKRYDRISALALALLVAGFGLQIAGNHPEWFGVVEVLEAQPERDPSA